VFAVVAGCTAALLVRCGGNADCASSADCSSGQQCVFGATAGCAAKGSCANATDNCDSTFVNVVCGCQGETVKEAKCLDVGGFLRPVNPAQHCFDPDAGTLFPPDGADDVGAIHVDGSAPDTAPPADATADARDAHDAD
jgi:hypothetical protein